jgi:nitrogen regulatory protein PII
MKLITAVIPAYLMDDLCRALLSIDVDDVTISDVRDHVERRLKSRSNEDRVCILSDSLKVSFEIVVLPAYVNEVIEAVSRVCGRSGDDCMVSVGERTLVMDRGRHLLLNE